MWARWVLAIGLGALLLYIGVVHGLIRQDISRSRRGEVEHVRGEPARVGGAAIALAGLALVALGVSTALAWPRPWPVFYGLWLVVGLGVGGFFLALSGRLPLR
ncbi:MAG TPA: hypothetical protein VET65_11800 [Candidatus Limnocylindrales bacterium]|nr:hypothetical protein [Candidatus Limnocylindrales bacterium]